MKFGLCSIASVERAEPAALVPTTFLGTGLNPLVLRLGRGGTAATIVHAVAGMDEW
jgi:hypothetical protein